MAKLSRRALFVGASASAAVAVVPRIKATCLGVDLAATDVEDVTVAVIWLQDEMQKVLVDIVFATAKYKLA